MPVIGGIKYSVQRANSNQEKLLKRYSENKNSISKLHEENALILKTLHTEIGNQCLVVKHEKSEAIEISNVIEGYRTYMISKPAGKYILFDELSVVHDAKTTKEDLNSIQEINIA